jgi:EAL domain-containing protein (putative c-di-GMP-specific phosphodiesterase class I)/PAS domain-containing protein/GGDEF domain-containing protein
MKQGWNITKRFLIIIPVVLLFLFIYNQLVLLETHNAKDKLIAEQKGHIGLLEYMVKHVFEDYRATLLLIRNANEFENYLATPSEGNLQEVYEFFLRMGNNRPYLLRIALSDSDGNTIIRYNADSHEICVDCEDLHKSCPNNQLILKDIQFLSPLEVSLSPLCLRERTQSGGDEFESVVHVALPVFNNGEFVGSIAITADGEHLRDLLFRFLAEGPALKQYGVLDDTGRWIYRAGDGIETEQFVDPETQDSVADSLAPLWDNLQENQIGTLDYEGTTYYYHTINPLEGFTNWYDSAATYWAVVVTFKHTDISRLEESFLLRNAPLRWVLALFILVVGGIINLLAYFRKNDKELLLVSNLVSEHSHDGVIIANALMQVTYCNRTFELISGFSKEKVIQGQSKMFSLHGEDLAPRMQHSRGKYDSWKGFVWLAGDGHYSLVHLLINAITNNQGKLIHHVGLISNPRNLSREPFDMIMQTHTDNPESIDIFPSALIDVLLQKPEVFCLLYIKITNIEQIEKGSSIEEHYFLSKELRERFSQDISSDDFIVQYSPDTFLLSMHVPGEEKIEERVRLIFSQFEEPLHREEKEQVMKILCGISQCSDTGVSAITMLSQARMALATLDHYQKSGFLVYDDGVNDQIRRYYDILHAFPFAIADKEIRVLFQPVVDTVTGAIVGAEALSRWNHPLLGHVSPGEFLPIIEQNGLEQMLGEYVLKDVVAFISRLSLPKEKLFSVSMNLCPTELQDKGLVSSMVKELDSYGIPHSRLVVELTERTLLTDLHAANLVLAKLREQDLKVAIDDFGTGFSSLSYLKNLKVDTLKIDRSFLKDYPEGDDGSILKAIVSMANELDMHVVAEGVETETQADFLRNIGCESYQGFLFSKAVDTEAFIQLLSQDTR